MACIIDWKGGYFPVFVFIARTHDIVTHPPPPAYTPSRDGRCISSASVRVWDSEYVDEQEPTSKVFLLLHRNGENLVRWTDAKGVLG